MLESKRLSVKHLKTVGVFVVLFGLPLGSWYYLNSGFEYRKASLEQLSPKDSLSNSNFLYQWKYRDSLISILEGKTTCLFNGSDYSFVEKYVDQYKDAPSFQTIIFGSASDVESDFISNGDVIYFNRPAPIFENNAIIALIDEDGYVRNYYIENVNDLTKLIEHTAIVLPRKVTKDIKLKSDKNGTQRK